MKRDLVSVKANPFFVKLDSCAKRAGNKQKGSNGTKIALSTTPRIAALFEIDPFEMVFETGFHFRLMCLWKKPG
uniref:Uncharacterized protein n=1 Tax=Candidatus Kentrum sp. LFY TaxID=2126342 RepID=A0A450WCC9_9GAMM|nr:MAG: hypothetical protein BECKLFY1418C_GA0070996_101028 [Candidatus Kentron sp. LFY]